MKAKAPGKIIISGEHAVVYGKPALVMAINQYVETTIDKTQSGGICFTVITNGKSEFLACSVEEVAHSFYSIRENFTRFLDGKIKINKVLSTWSEFISYAFYLIVHEHSTPAISGMKLTVDLNIPAGCGMGSSAATALSVLKATATIYDIELPPEILYDYAMRCENLCHGKASGVDPYTSLYGGFLRFQDQQKKRFKIPKIKFYVAITGRPESSTGECVMHVKDNFKHSGIWNDFEKVTIKIEHAIMDHNFEEFAKEIRKNHRLLCTINVVPETVQAFIAGLEEQGYAAKVSGAGSISGNHGGAVLIFGKSSPRKLCSRYHYQLLTIQGENEGVRTI